MLELMSVEPIMLVHAACSQLLLYVAASENMKKICSVNLGLSTQICGDLSSYPEENQMVMSRLSSITFWNGILLTMISFLSVLYMGAWSDKYGRKVSLLKSLIGHALYTIGCFIIKWQTSWPVEVMYGVTLLKALGGGDMELLSTTITYVSDITTKKNRTSRISTAMSLWCFGSSLGIYLAYQAVQYTSDRAALGLVLSAYVSAIVYVLYFIKESHGPFADNSLQNKEIANKQTEVQQRDVSISCKVKDFFNFERVVESFMTAFRTREGKTGKVVLTIIFAHLLHRIGAGFNMFQFVQEVLQWKQTDYIYWLSYQKLVIAVGSLYLVPLLTKVFSFCDSSLVVLGSFSIIAEYICYGIICCASESPIMWIAPAASFISNASVIAFRSLSTKLVSHEEYGRINAVMTAMTDLMPTLGATVYFFVYRFTADIYPAAQFLFGASLNVIIMVLFIVFLLVGKFTSSETEDTEGKEPKKRTGLLDVETLKIFNTYLCKNNNIEENNNNLISYQGKVFPTAVLNEDSKAEYERQPSPSESTETIEEMIENQLIATLPDESNDSLHLDEISWCESLDSEYVYSGSSDDDFHEISLSDEKVCIEREIKLKDKIIQSMQDLRSSRISLSEKSLL